jgi:hypothetical protein
MKVRITVLTENDKPLPPIGERPTEEQVVKAWQVIFDIMALMGEPNEKATVESVEFIEEVPDGQK